MRGVFNDASINVVIALSSAELEDVSELSSNFLQVNEIVPESASAEPYVPRF